MANFPSGPDQGDPHVDGGVTWIYDGTKWQKQAPTLTTGDVALFDPAHPANSLPLPQTLPDVPPDTTSQYDVNRWFVSALTSLDDHFEDGSLIAGIHVGEDEPADKVNGTLWFDSSPDALSLFLYYHPDESKPSGIWVPAAPPVSAIDEITQLLGALDQDVDALEERVLDLNTSGNAPPNPVQDGFIWRDTTPGSQKAYIYGIDASNAAAWLPLSPAAVVNASAPADPTEGELWLNNNGDVLSIYTGTEWLPVGGLTQDVLDRLTTIEEDVSTNTDDIQQLRLSVDDLATTRGKVARYKVDNTIGTPVVRSGDISVNIPYWPNTSQVSFGVEDLDGIITKPIADGDIIDFIDIATEKLSRYKVTDASGAPTLVGVEYVSGDGDWAREQEKQVYIYPQNQAGVSKDYVDDGLALKANKDGDTFTGSLTVSTQGNANNDGVRFYMKDMNGATNFTIFPTGVVTGKDVIRVNKDAGDCFQVKDASGSTVKWKVDADGMNSTPKIYLTGDAGADINKRVIDVQQGQSGRLAYNSATRMSWGANNVWIGTTTTTGEASSSVNLDLQGNPITNVGSFELNHTGQSNGNKFVINGETADGLDNALFYSYKNDDGTIDAVNYKGRMTNEFNIVNKGYVDNSVSSIDSSTFMPKIGGTFTGTVEFNHSNNAQINFPRTGNNDIQVDGAWYISLQTADGGKVKLSKNLEMTNKEIKGLAAPTTGQSAVNRDSLVGAKVAATSNANASSGGFYYNSGRLYYKI